MRIKRIKNQSLKHYTEMIEWVEKQNSEEEPDFKLMIAEIGTLDNRRIATLKTREQVVEFIQRCR